MSYARALAEKLAMENTGIPLWFPEHEAPNVQALGAIMWAAHILGAHIEYESPYSLTQLIPGSLGGFIPARNLIIIPTWLEPHAMQIRVIAHELAHYILGDTWCLLDMLNWRSEIIADLTAFSVCNTLGLNMDEICGRYVSFFMAKANLDITEDILEDVHMASSLIVDTMQEFL